MLKEMFLQRRTGAAGSHALKALRFTTMSISRRRFVAGALGATIASGLYRPRAARAIGDSSKFRFGHLQLGESWNPRPGSLKRMAWEIAKRTSIDVELESRVVTLDSETLHETPLLYLAGDREFDVPSERDVAALRRFLTFGGFLIIDSAEGSTDGAFDYSVRRLVEAVFPPPSTKLEIVPGDHVVYKSFYLIDRPVGRLAISPIMEGILHDSRLVVAYSQNDFGGAFARDNFGNFEYQCVPGGHQQRQLAFRMMVNLVMYAMCLDYKTDQVHVPFIMRRRRWRPNDGATEAAAPGSGKVPKPPPDPPERPPR